RFRTGTAEFLGDVHFELLGIFQNFPQDWRRSPPVVAVLASHNQHLRLRWPCRRRLLGVHHPHRGRHQNCQSNQSAFDGPTSVMGTQYASLPRPGDLNFRGGFGWDWDALKGVPYRSGNLWGAVQASPTTPSISITTYRSTTRIAWNVAFDRNVDTP